MGSQVIARLPILAMFYFGHEYAETSSEPSVSLLSGAELAHEPLSLCAGFFGVEMAPG